MLLEKDLQEHMLATYITLRYGIAVIAILFPLLLWFGGKYQGIELQESMSAYYHANADGSSMRDWFVGILFAVSISLYLYKGYGPQENIALNIAGILGVCVALIPTSLPDATDSGAISLHGTCAVLFFCCIGYVCIFRATNTLHFLPTEKQPAYRSAYRGIGIAMVISPLAAFILTSLVDYHSAVVFFIEAFGIWAFASYWFLKSREISISHTEEQALTANLKAKNLQDG